MVDRDIPRTVVVAGRNQYFQKFLRIFGFKELLLILALRDYKARYAQTFLGILWALIQPLVTLVIFILVFDKAAKIDSGDIPYPVFAMSGIALWSFISFTLTQSGGSLIAAQEMVKKIYFPRLILPISKSIVGMVDLIISLLFLLVISLVMGVGFDMKAALFPLILLYLFVVAMGPSLWLSALSIRYRDFQHTIPFLVQIGLYISPIAYPSSLITSNLDRLWAYVYYLNPVAGLIDVFRWTLFGSPLDLILVCISFFMCLIIFFGGLVYFQRMEKIIADYV